MTRTIDTDQLLPALVDAFSKDGHFVLAKQGKVFVRIITEEDDERSSSEFCLSDIAALLVERLSK